MQIFVKTSGHGVVAVTCKRDETVSDVRRMLVDYGCSLPESSYLCQAGRRMDMGARLLDLPPYATLDSYVPLRGGGGDGGATGAESRDCYLKMYMDKKPDKVDPNEARLAKWVSCRLTADTLKPPCAVDMLGNIFNKEDVVHALVAKSLPPSLSHIRGLKDLVTVHLTPNPSAKDKDLTAVDRFCCPISGLEFNGKFKFVALRGCGHVLSTRAFKEVKSSACLVCHQPFTEEDQININGSDEEVDVLRTRMEAAWAKAKAEKMAMKGVKAEKKGGKLMEGVGGGGKKRSGEAGADTSSAGAASGGHGVRPSGSERVVTVKKYRAGDHAPEGATKEVYASIFTSSSKEKAETYACRNLPIGRN